MEPRVATGPRSEFASVAKIWEELQHQQSGTICSTLPTTDRGNKQFAAELAEVTGNGSIYDDDDDWQDAMSAFGWGIRPA